MLLLLLVACCLRRRWIRCRCILVLRMVCYFACAADGFAGRCGAPSELLHRVMMTVDLIDLFAPSEVCPHPRRLLDYLLLPAEKLMRVREVLDVDSCQD